VSRANATLASMGKELVSDELWKVIKPLLPSVTQKLKGGRPRVPDRAALSGIVFALRTGIPWSMLPNELGFGGIVTAACDDVALQYIPNAWSSFLEDMRKVSAPRPPGSISAQALF
jgi:transposase